MTPQKKPKPFDPDKEATIDNPIPGSIYDPKTRKLLGYEPHVIHRGPEQYGDAPVGRAEGGATSEPAATSPPRDWRTERAKKSFVQNVAQDLRETADDIKDEPSEVPFRIKERVKEYLPRWKQHLNRK